MAICSKLEQTLILNVDDDWEGGLLVTRKMLAIIRNLITPFLRQLRRLGRFQGKHLTNIDAWPKDAPLAYQINKP